MNKVIKKLFIGSSKTDGFRKSIAWPYHAMVIVALIEIFSSLEPASVVVLSIADAIGLFTFGLTLMHLQQEKLKANRKDIPPTGVRLPDLPPPGNIPMNPFPDYPSNSREGTEL